MKTFLRWLVASGLAAICFTVSATSASRTVSKECLEIGYQNGSTWVYHHATIESENGDRMIIRYDYHDGRLNLKISERQKSGGQEIYVMSGRWTEDRGRASGRVSLKMEAGSHHATGWYQNGDTGPKYDLVLRECHG